MNEPSADGKTCSRCNEWKTLAEFYRKKGTRDGRQAHCKGCEKADQKDRYARSMKDPEKAAARRARESAYEAEHREQRREYIAAWRARNLDRHRAMVRAWKKANPEQYREINRRYEQANPEKGRERVNRRRARIKEATVGVVDFVEILQVHGMTCHLCQGDIDGKDDLHFDHVIPLARGGAHSMDNIRPAHVKCNLRKADKLVSELTWAVAA